MTSTAQTTKISSLLLLTSVGRLLLAPLLLYWMVTVLAFPIVFTPKGDSGERVRPAN